MLSVSLCLLLIGYQRTMRCGLPRIVVRRDGDSPPGKYTLALDVHVFARGADCAPGHQEIFGDI